MKENEQHLFIGRVEFSDPVLLISGDEQSLLWLADRIESRQLTSLREGHPSFVIADGSMTLIPVQGAGRLDEKPARYDWRIGKNQSQEFVARLRVLAVSTGPGHAYLDTEAALQIVASKGEYDLNHLISARSSPRTGTVPPGPGSPSPSSNRKS